MNQKMRCGGGVQTTMGTIDAVYLPKDLGGQESSFGTTKQFQSQHLNAFPGEHNRMRMSNTQMSELRRDRNEKTRQDRGALDQKIMIIEEAINLDQTLSTVDRKIGAARYSETFAKKRGQSALQKKRNNTIIYC